MSSRKLELQIKTEFLEVVEGVKSTSGSHKAKCKNLIIRSKKNVLYQIATRWADRQRMEADAINAIKDDN